jgi:hypothetical protein
MNKKLGALSLLLGVNALVPVLALAPSSLGTTQNIMGTGVILPAFLALVYLSGSSILALGTNTPRERVAALAAHVIALVLLAVAGVLALGMSAGAVFSLFFLGTIHLVLWLAATEPEDSREPQYL